MSTMLEKLAGAKALIDAAIEEELARTGPPPTEKQGGCEHKVSQDITAVGDSVERRACVDCGEKWEVGDGS